MRFHVDIPPVVATLGEASLQGHEFADQGIDGGLRRRAGHRRVAGPMPIIALRRLVLLDKAVPVREREAEIAEGFREDILLPASLQDTGHDGVADRMRDDRMGVVGRPAIRCLNPYRDVENQLAVVQAQAYDVSRRVDGCLIATRSCSEDGHIRDRHDPLLAADRHEPIRLAIDSLDRALTPIALPKSWRRGMPGYGRPHLQRQLTSQKAVAHSGPIIQKIGYDSSAEAISVCQVANGGLR